MITRLPKYHTTWAGTHTAPGDLLALQIPANVIVYPMFAHVGDQVSETARQLLFKWSVRSVAGSGGQLLFPTPTQAGYRDYTATVPFPITSAMLSQSGVTSFTASLAVDGILGEQNAFHTDSSSSGTTITVDLGAGNAQEFVRGGMHWAGTYNGTWVVEWSDNGSSWTTVTSTYHPNIPIVSSGDFGWRVYTWATAGARRYWRFRLTNTPGAGAWGQELAFWTQQGTLARGNDTTDASGLEPQIIVEKGGSIVGTGWYWHHRNAGYRVVGPANLVFTLVSDPPDSRTMYYEIGWAEG